MWSEACAQIFFTLSICIGVMVSYASYNPIDAPIITNGFAVSLCNSCFSFFAGFAVFSTVGYLVGMNSPVATKVSSIGLAFIAYPAALETLPGSNFWTLMLSVTLFTLGIDSAFAMVEATVTVVQESKIGEHMSKFTIAFLLCFLGSCCSFIFCFNWGFTFFDVVDHYLNVYLVLLMGILQATAVGWYHCQEDAIRTDKISSVILMMGYWGMLIPLGWLSYFAFPKLAWVGIVVFWVWTILIVLASFIAAKYGPAKLTFETWYLNIFLSGVNPICEVMWALENPVKQEITAKQT